MRLTVLRNRETGDCILEYTYSDNTRECEGVYSTPVAKHIAGTRQYRVVTVEPYSDAWQEARAMLDDDAEETY